MLIACACIDKRALKVYVQEACDEHTCDLLAARKHHRKAKSRRIASVMKDRISYHLGPIPAKIRTDTQREYGVSVSYYMSWKWKELALEELHGTWRRPIAYYCLR